MEAADWERRVAQAEEVGGKDRVAKSTVQLEEALKESSDLCAQLAGNFHLGFALIGFVPAL